MSNRRKIKNNNKNHQMNNDKVNKSMMDWLKNKNISTTLVTKFGLNHSTMYVDFGNKKDMEDYINKVKKHQLPEEFFDRLFKEPPKELSEKLNEEISNAITEEVIDEIANKLNEEPTDELREEIYEVFRKKVLEDFREEVIEEFYEGIEIFKPYLENNKIGLIRIF